MDAFTYLLVVFTVFVVVLGLVMGYPLYRKCSDCEYKMRPYEIHKCPVSGRRRICK